MSTECNCESEGKRPMKQQHHLEQARARRCWESVRLRRATSAC